MTAGPVVVAGRYRLGETLGQGGMGRVFLARDEVLDRDVAIKEIVLPEELVDDDREAAQERTLREARAAARISHPSAVQVYDVVAADGATWIVMEYVPSRSLREAIAEDGPMEPRRAAEIGLAVLGALEAAHKAGVHHRDVKPANVLLGDDGRVVLTDFGIATIEGDGIVTSSDLVLGSPQYMSPERIRDGTALPGSDLWSLGATLFTAVEGHSPYERASVIETLTAVAAEEPEAPRHAGVLAPVLDGLLRKEAGARIDLAETRRLLEAALQDEPPAPVRRSWLGRQRPASAVIPRQRVPEGGTRTPPEAAPGKRRRGLVAAGAATVVVLGAGAWFGLRDGDGDPGRSTPAAVPARTTASPAPASAAAVPPASASPASSSPAASPATGQAGNAVTRPPLPSGWRDYRDPTGFRVYVPKGWKKSQRGTMVYFRDGKGRVLGIDQTDKPRPDPAADWRGKAKYRVGAGDFPDYDQIRISPVKYWRKAADWEFTFSGSNRRHVNNRGVITSAKQAYGIYWETSDATWRADRDDLELVFDSFRPRPA